MIETEAAAKRWYAMRDLKRKNALHPAYEQLSESGLQVFTPLRNALVAGRGGNKVRRTVPVIPDLLFVREAKDVLDPVVASIPTLQYRYRRGYSAATPTTVRDADMNYFIMATRAAENPRYYLPEEITPDMLRRRIRIVGGPLDGIEGCLLTVRGSRSRRLLVEIPGFISAAIEVEPEYIQLV